MAGPYPTSLIAWNSPTTAPSSLLLKNFAHANGFDAFPQFPRLPAEIRLKIWEDAWPEPRVVEVTHGKGPGASILNDAAEPPYLRPRCRLSTWLQHEQNSDRWRTTCGPVGAGHRFLGHRQNCTPSIELLICETRYAPTPLRHSYPAN